MDKEPRIYSIKDINKYIRMKLDSDSLLGDVWLRGELSNFTHHSSGHMYFTLKDKDSRLKCVMFASHNAKLPFIPREGAKVLARGHVAVYERDGTYQFYATAMQPDGLGSLYLAFEQLKGRLDSEGLFAVARKRPLPPYPAAIGVVTSPTGAAVRDIITTVRRRSPSVSIYIYPAIVQGEQGAASIVHAIEALNRHGECDVLIVGRGGGSLEELWAFNEETVARAIAASAIPVISAVGHETDFTIADFVADLRAATPTAAAELVVPSHTELRQRCERQRQRLLSGIQGKLRPAGERLLRLRRSPLFLQPGKYLLNQAQRVDLLNEQLRRQMERIGLRARASLDKLRISLEARHPGERVQFAARRLSGVRRQLELAAGAAVKERRGRLGGHIRQLDALSPLKVMARGYSLVYDNREQALIKSIRDAAVGDAVLVKLSDGELACRVHSVKGEPGDGQQA